MIKVLRGKIIDFFDNSVILDVSGFGILVKVLVCDVINGIGEDEVLYTNMIITENNIGIYGFKSKSKCEMFEKLIKIKGVGPSIGINILNEITDLALVNLDDLLKIKGVGSKLANTVLTELNRNTNFCVDVREFVKLGFKKEDVLKVAEELKNKCDSKDFNKNVLEKLCEVKKYDNM